MVPGSTCRSACTRRWVYYYYPGFHEPGSGFSLGINKRLWESLNSGERQLIEAIAACEYTRSLAEFNANNALSLHELRQEGSVKIQKFDDSVLKALREISREVVAENASRPNTDLDHGAIYFADDSGRTDQHKHLHLLWSSPRVDRGSKVAIHP